MEVLTRSEVKKGKAQIICELERGKIKYYDIEIERIYINNQKDNKSMQIKVTDDELLEKTRRNNSTECLVHLLFKMENLYGAVTHVLVNDPTTGFGVFADMMLKQMAKNCQ